MHLINHLGVAAIDLREKYTRLRERSYTYYINEIHVIEKVQIF